MLCLIMYKMGHVAHVQIMSTQEVIHRDTAVIMALIIIRMIPAAMGTQQ